MSGNFFNILVEALGWLGTALIVWAYFLISNKKIDLTSGYYQGLNLVGAICLGVNVFYKQAWPALVLEIIWALIAMIALMRNQKPRDLS